MSLFQVTSLKKSFVRAEERIHVLRGVNFTLAAGKSLAITGASGSGKSTLLHCLGLLEDFDEGQILLHEQNYGDLEKSEKLLIRREKIGFVFQFHYLMAELSAIENVSLPLLIAGLSQSHAEERAKDWLNRVGLSHRLKHRPRELSGGEQQRVAIARALIHEPSVIIADEPTGNLDSETEARVFSVFLERIQDLNSSLIVATHNLELATQMDAHFQLKGGRLEAAE